MRILYRVEEILSELRPVFSRQAANEIVRTADVGCFTMFWADSGNELSERRWEEANTIIIKRSSWFHSHAWSIVKLSQTWGKWLLKHKDVHRLRGKPVYVGDGIKVSKEGRKMPGVKRLHQESDNTSKPDWIRGHYFGCLSLLLERRSINNT